MIEELLDKRNLNQAYQKVVTNKGAAGVDGMSVDKLLAHLHQEGATMMRRVRSGSYQPSPIKGVNIPKSNGKTRLLGVPTVTDRMLQQAQRNINEGCHDIVDIDLKSFFDEVDHVILLELVFRKVKCPLTMRLLRSFLRAPIQIEGKLHKRRKGMP